MNYTTNFNLNKPEGTDLYNHLTIDNPNMDIIDAAMQANKLASVGAATELVSGTVHAITRSDSNQNIFKFKATGNYNAGDTITVDGITVNAYTTAGQQLPNDAYVLSAEVLCVLDGTSLWVLTNKTPDIMLKRGSNTFTGKSIWTGHSTGSGNYVDVFVPIPVSDDVTSASISVDTITLYSSGGSISISTLNATILDITKFGICFEIVLPNPTNPSLAFTVSAINLSITCA